MNIYIYIYKVYIIATTKKKRSTIPMNHNILFPLPKYPEKENIKYYRFR